MLFDLKALNTTLDQLEQEKKIPRTAIIEAIEQALSAAYKKDYGKRGQIIRAKFNSETGDVEFSQVKVVVDESIVKPALTEEETEAIKQGTLVLEEDPEDHRVRFNAEHHMYLEDARRIKTGAEIEDEITFPLDVREDFGRIAAQTAKQVIIQRLREAERGSVLSEYTGLEGTVVNGIVQKVSRGAIIVDVGRATGIIAPAEKIPGEYYRTGQHIKAYLYQVEDSPRGVVLHLSRSHPRLIEALFAFESPEIAAGSVEIRSIAREAGSRSKIAVVSHDPSIDPIGACVGQKGVRVMTVSSELSREKVDVVPWAEDPAEFVSNALSPARVLAVDIDQENHIAYVTVAEDQLSLAIGKEGQNVRLAVKLTGWKIDIAGVGPNSEGVTEVTSSNAEGVPVEVGESETAVTPEAEMQAEESSDTTDEAVTEETEN